MKVTRTKPPQADPMFYTKILEENHWLKIDLKSMKESFALANNWRNEHLDDSKKLDKFKEYNFELKRWTGDDFEWAFNQVKDKFKETLET